MITTSSIPSLLTFRKGTERTKQKKGGHNAYSEWIRLGGVEDEETSKKSRKKPINNKNSNRHKKRNSKIKG